MDPTPKNSWGGGLTQVESINLSYRARLGLVTDRIPGEVETDGSDTLREG